MENSIKIVEDGILVQLNGKRAPKPFVIALNDFEKKMTYEEAEETCLDKLPTSLEAIAISANLEIINGLIEKAGGTPIEFQIYTNNQSVYLLRSHEFEGMDMWNNTYSYRFISRRVN